MYEPVLYQIEYGWMLNEQKGVNLTFRNPENSALFGNRIFAFKSVYSIKCSKRSKVKYLMRLQLQNVNFIEKLVADSYSAW